MTIPVAIRSSSWKADGFLVGFFMLVLLLPLAGKLLRSDQTVAASENRRLMRFPKVNLDGKSLTAFPSNFERYFDDQFGFRDQLIHLHHLIKLQWLGVSPTPKVVLGKEGWMFDRDTVQYYEAPPLVPEALENWRRFLEERQAFVAAKGYPFLLVFAPLSSTIYPEYLPDSVRHLPRTSRLDQLLAYLRTNSSIPTLDLREALLSAKKTERLYQRTDTHWNELGAFHGYQEIMRSIAGNCRQTGPVPRSEFDIREHHTAGGDIARLMGLADRFPEQHFEFSRRGGAQAHVAEWYPEGARVPMGFSMKTDDSSKPRAIVYHDSFAFESLYKFLAENFSEVWFHWNHYYDPDLSVQMYSNQTSSNFHWRPEEQAGLAVTNQPLFVIVEIAERQLLYPPPPTWKQLEQRRLAKSK